VVGVADEVAAGVDTVVPGQVVAGGTWVLGVGGGHSEYLCLPADQLVETGSTW
jgi:NADPH:quinone reductase-like Zn-dependent oxidoreductase